MIEERRQILEMLASGKIATSEAESLLSALNKSSASANSSQTPNSFQNPKPKYLRVVVESDGEHGDAESPTKVNIKIPIQLLKAGVKLAGFIPNAAKDQINEALRENGMNVDVSQIKPDNIDELIENLNDLTIDVDEKHNKVRIFCE